MNQAVKQFIGALLSTNKKTLLGITIIVAIILRVVLAITTTGYENDLALFHYWATHSYNSGILDFYQLDIFVDYPPGYIYILYLLGLVLHFVSPDVNSVAYLFILKLPIIVFDLAAALVLYRIAKKNISLLQSYGLLVLLLFNPWTLVNGTVWGQVDIVFSFALVLSLYYLKQQKTVAASLLYAIAALIKPQAFIFFPVILIYLAFSKQIKQWLISATVGFGSFLLLAMPFFIKGEGISQLISLYKQTLSSYPYASLNTYNAYSLFGYNWVSIKERIFTLPIELISTLTIGLVVILVLYYSIRLKKTGSYYFYLAAITIASVYLFVAKMHERYLFPLLLCLLFAYIFEKNKHYIYILLGFSVTTTINLIAVLQIQHTTYTIAYDFFLVSCSVINMVLYVYLLVIGYKGFHREAGIKERYRLSVFAILIIYSIVAFYQLGDRHAPQTMWQATESSEYVVFDLGENQLVEQMAIFSGASHAGSYGVSIYADDQWHDVLTIENKHTNALAHQIWDIQEYSQYMMLYAITPGFVINEVAFFSHASSEPLPVTINLTSSEPNEKYSPYHLIDEQDYMVNKPTYLNGSYFDEIYHARTAFEYINGMSIYETTHPPLGKLLIALGIKLFGFGPFGWRVMGTCFGILVLLIIYFFARLLFDKPSYGIAAMALFAVDFMHFTQSRIATIDIYSITFTLLMFLFMTWYSKMSLYHEKFWKVLLPLGLSGLCFGLGIATKWNGFYGGMGLAIMLAIVLIKHYVQYRAEGKLVRLQNKSNTKPIERKAVGRIAEDTNINQPKQGLSTLLKSVVKPSQYWNAFTVIILYCCLFFVVIPAIIYYLVYQLSFKLTGQASSWSNFIDSQQHMFSYHSDLVASHPFSSAWYEWQLMIKPIWYYINNNLDHEGLTSTISAFGNPLIWWLGIITMLVTLAWSLYKKDTTISVIYIAYFTQLIPWMFVDRITFIYHFFGMVPFVILSIVYIFKQLEKRFEWVSIIRFQYVLLALIVFIMFYPVLSGETIERSYVDHILRWFNSWYF